MTRKHIILKLQSILLVILLICTIATPASAINTIDNPNIDELNKNDLNKIELDIDDINIDDIRKYLNLPESTNPAKLIKTTDGNYFLLTSDSEQAPEYFNWVNNKDTYKIVEDKDGNLIALIPAPYDKKPANAGSCWPFQCIQAIIPAAAAAGAAGVYMAADAVETITIAAIGFVSIAFMNEVYEKAKELSQNDLDKYDFYELKGNFIQKSKLSSAEALEQMKDCDPGNPVKIGSTKEGCETLALIVTKILNGNGLKYHTGKTAVPDHVHATQPPSEEGNYHHCKSHCYWNYEDFFKGKSRGGGQPT